LAFIRRKACAFRDKAVARQDPLAARRHIHNVGLALLNLQRLRRR
jgi:hypothetical protein